MAGPAFLWLLAALTALTGAVLVVMLIRRWSARSIPEPRGAARRERRLIDDYAIDVELTPPADEEPAPAETWSKICPACGSRYGHQYRTCARDDSELATIN